MITIEQAASDYSNKMVKAYKAVRKLENGNLDVDSEDLRRELKLAHMEGAYEVTARMEKHLIEGKDFQPETVLNQIENMIETIKKTKREQVDD